MRDSDFVRGDRVPMTKEEGRSVTLMKMDILNGKRFLDVGAGSGSVSIEAAVANPAISVTAIEMKDSACDVIRKNVKKVNLSNYSLITGKAPCELTGSYDRIFIGGSGGALADIVEWCHGLLEPGGILAANFIIMDNAICVYRMMKELGLQDIEMIQLSSNRMEKMGRYEYLKPINPIFIISGKKEK